MTAFDDRSAVYVGWLRHRRFRPVAHEFTYPLFMVLLDVDRVAALMQTSALTSYNRWNVASFDDRDHFGPRDLPLRARLVSDAGRHDVALPDGPIYLLTHLRYLGYAFNPVSFYYCFDREGVLRRVLAEVNNTFGGSRNYWLAPHPSATGDRDGNETRTGTFISSAAKNLYVSPFMADALDYGFSFTRPEQRLVAHMTVSTGDSSGPLFDATLSLERRPWTAASVRSALWRYPVMTAQVTAAIHWEAWKLWRKGMKVVPRRHPQGLTPGDISAGWPAPMVEP